MQSPKRILIVGASARAAAESASTAGLDVQAIDLFADVDTRECCEAVVRIDQLEEAVVAASEIETDALMYTGCLENRPELISQLSRRFRLLGNSADSLKLVRDPFWIQKLAIDDEFGFPETSRVPQGTLPSTSAENSWLRKPFNSGSGWNIREVTQADSETNDSQFYFQRLVEGESFSAAFVTDSQQTNLIGVSKQILGPNEFHYRGSIGPIELPNEITDELRKIGRVLAKSANLRGLFGVDFVLRNRSIYVIEVNPRYTASMEIYESLCAVSIVDLHLHACTGDVAFESLIQCSLHAKILCKLIHFLDDAQPITVSEKFDRWQNENASSLGSIHDIPESGTKIKPGEPVFTAIASGDTIEQARNNCEELIQKAMCEIR